MKVINKLQHYPLAKTEGFEIFRYRFKFSLINIKFIGTAISICYHPEFIPSLYGLFRVILLD